MAWRSQPKPPASKASSAREASALPATLQFCPQLGQNNTNNNNNNSKDKFNITPITPLQVNLQDQLKDMFQDPVQAPILLCLGQKGGGKSFRTMTLLMWLLHNNVFDQYFLVLPTFFFEAANSYAWLKPFEKKVFILREYTPEISQAFLQRPDETIPPHEIPRTFLWMDDVGMNETFRNDRHFVGLLSVARHKRLSVCLCYHSLSSGHTLSPFLRQNVTHTLIFRVTNEKLLESIYEELISMTGHFQRFREFKQVYNQHTCSRVNPQTGEVDKNFNGICINNSLGCMDWKVSDWFPQETELLKTFLENMKEIMEQQKLPAPADNQNLKEITPQMVSNVQGALPKHTHTQLAPGSWQKLSKAADDPMVFLTHPRNLARYLPKRGHSY